jgi:hypothetical protein
MNENEDMEVGGSGAGKPAINRDDQKIRNGAIVQIFLGDSHLRPQHHAPDAYQKAVERGEGDDRFGAPTRVEEWEQPGSKMAQGYHLTKEYLEQVLALIHKYRDYAVAIVLSIGTNDLRGDKTKRKVEELEQRFEKIIQKVEETPGVVLYLVAPIPCATEGIYHLRESLDHKMWNLCRKADGGGVRRVFYVSLFRPRNPRIPMERGKYHQEKFWQDEIHLNRAGAQKLMEELIKAQKFTPSEAFATDSEVWEKLPANEESGDTHRSRSRTLRNQERREIRAREKERASRTPEKGRWQPQKGHSQAIGKKGRASDQKGGLGGRGVKSRLGWKANETPQQPQGPHGRGGNRKTVKDRLGWLSHETRCRPYADWYERRSGREDDNDRDRDYPGGGGAKNVVIHHQEVHVHHHYGR